MYVYVLCTRIIFLLQIFSKYEQHRRLLLEDILASIARIPSSKHNLRSFQLSSNQHIQMLTALVLQLVQCVVTLPESMCKSQEKEKELSDSDKKVSVVHVQYIKCTFNVILYLH